MINLQRLFFFSILCSLSIIQAGSIEEALGDVIQSPRFLASEVTYLPADGLTEELRCIIGDQLESTNYDRLSVSLQLMDHLNNTPGNPLEALKAFRIKLDDLLGGPCVALALDLLDRLPGKINGYIVAAKLPKKYQQEGFPYYCHAAVMIKYQNPIVLEDRGYIILDPSFDFHEPIAVPDNGKTVYYNRPGRDRWSFWVDGDEIICQIVPEYLTASYVSADYVMIYRTDRLLNPLEASANPMLLFDRRLSLLSRDRYGKHLFSLSVELDKEQLVWSANGKKMPPLSFSALKNGEVLPIEFAASLRMGHAELMNKIIRVIELRHTLYELSKDYLLLENGRLISYPPG